ncbi:hypothetical protein BGZ97_008443 [Linnemannia gamsii]|uniref:Uncharacterized protein n=1 Tax=Linnemannia gamsii TaxID=64522 RepID=A0A9P6QRX2_9FUNG|nr:hypothetical protein BGZ97_008443 [Linnemannia gamsii]
MTAQRPTHGTKRPGQRTRFDPELQSPPPQAPTQPANLTSSSQYHSAPDVWSVGDDSECDPDESVCLTQAPSLQEEAAHSLAPHSSSVSASTSVSVSAPTPCNTRQHPENSESVGQLEGQGAAVESVYLTQAPLTQVPVPPGNNSRSRAPTPVEMPTVPEAWVPPVLSQTSAVYLQQLQVLFTEIQAWSAKLRTCTSAQEHQHIYDVHQDLCRREQEIRYLLEARCTWEAQVAAYQQRMTDLSFVHNQNRR